MEQRRAILAILGLVAALLVAPGAAAQSEQEGDGFLLRVNGSTTVGATEVTDSVFAVNGDAVVNGTVRDALVVVNGNATVTSRVEGDVLVVDGTLVRGTLTQAPGATIAGELSERSEFVNFGWGRGVFSFLGGLLVALAGVVGAGALGVLAYRGWSGHRRTAARPAPAPAA